MIKIRCATCDHPVTLDSLVAITFPCPFCDGPMARQITHEDAMQIIFGTERAFRMAANAHNN